MDVRSKANVSNREKTDLTADRDAHGQQEREGSEERKKLSLEELADILSYLKEIPGVRENHLQIRLSKETETPVVFIEDLKGKVIRRIPESELVQLTKDKSRKTGKIFDKAM